jgi:hypothetical protein
MIERIRSDAITADGIVFSGQHFVAQSWPKRRLDDPLDYAERRAA